MSKKTIQPNVPVPMTAAQLTKLPRFSHFGRLTIGTNDMRCYVLDEKEKRRIVLSSDVADTLSMVRVESWVDTMNKLIADSLVGLTATAKKSYGGKIELIKFIDEKGILAAGVEGDAVIKVASALLLLSVQGRLEKSMKDAALRASRILSAVSTIGIIALIDEATGYQTERSARALQEILEKYLAPDFRAWSKMFPDEFYKQIFRLRGWDWKGMKVNRPQCIAHYTNVIVYRRLPEGILEELRKRNPLDCNGRRKQRHHQWMSADTGVPELDKLLDKVTLIMRLSKNWGSFKENLSRELPIDGEQQLLDLDLDDGWEPSALA